MNTTGRECPRRTPLVRGVRRGRGYIELLRYPPLLRPLQSPVVCSGGTPSIPSGISVRINCKYRDTIPTGREGVGASSRGYGIYRYRG